MTPPAARTRTLSTAEERREAIVEAGMRVMAARGFHGTPTMEVAKAAGISQAYLFRLFPTKIDLAVALVERCNERIHATFVAAAAKARAEGEDVLHAMGESYAELIQDRTMLLLQMHGHAAAVDEPAIRAAMQEGFRRLHALIRAETGADDHEISGFFATGMLMNVLAAMGAFELDEPWATSLCAYKDDDDPA
ncbi:MAG: TetR/AcrR family transcriptional regulator [Solirubrobacterales bacterium]|nr:TetR/AcrR family transcriptional regulator [Solirubrobacterales bacterium]